MRFGIFYEHQLPRPWEADGEHELLQQSLDQIGLADQLGYDYAWEVEHHFLEEYSHSSAPEVFLAAASQPTNRIRPGHGVIQLTTNHPARVAERVSTLDLVSNGRVELGTGESSTTTDCTPSTAGSVTSARCGKTPYEKMHAGGLIGSPETIRTKLRKFEASHVDQVILLNQAGRNTHDDICASLELFAAEVMPEFVDRHHEHEAWKQQVLAGDITLDEVDTSPEAMPRPRRGPVETRS